MSAETTNKIFNNYELSICFWIYVDADTGTSASTGALFGNDRMSGKGNDNRKFSLFQYPTCNDLHLSWQKDGVTYGSLSGVISGVLKSYKWTHVTVAYKEGVARIYINGVLKSTISGDITSATYAYQTQLLWDSASRKICDFRLYNECLSPRQVKEISKGLICHYPLGEIDGKIGGRNLATNTNKGTTGWSWSMQTGGYSATEIVEDGISSCRLTRNSVAQSGWSIIGYSYIGRDKWKANTTYVVSVEVKASVSNTYLIPQFREWNGSNILQQSITSINSKTIANTWVKMVWIVKSVATLPSSTNQNTYFTGMDNTPGTWYQFRNLKIEEGSSPTPWTPAPEDDTSFYDNVIYDTSGYGNNGSVTDSICPTWSSDTPRYKGSYMFNGNKQVINTPNVFHQEDITISFWFKRLKDTSTRQFLFTIYYGFSCELTADDIPFFRIATDASHTVDALSDKKITVNDGWTHFCGVYKNGEYSKIYINGQLKKSVSSTSKIYWNIHSSKIGIYNNYNTYYNGQISDVRIYATALSDSDILELYQSSASVDNNGNLMLAGEVIEE